MTVEQEREEFDPSPKVWDDQALLRTLGHADREVHLRVLQRFAAHTGKQLSDLSRLCDLGDFYAIGTLAHNAKTAARTVGAMQLGQLCDQLETSCAEGNESAVRKQVVEIVRAYEAIQTYLPQPASAS